MWLFFRLFYLFASQIENRQIVLLQFTATLRHLQDPSSGVVCLKMDMSAGHFSASDRYKYLKELAFDYAFMLDQLGLAK